MDSDLGLWGKREDAMLNGADELERFFSDQDMVQQLLLHYTFPVQMYTFTCFMAYLEFCFLQQIRKGKTTEPKKK